MKYELSDNDILKIADIVESKEVKSRATFLKQRMPMTGFKVPENWKSHIDRKEITDENGEIDYKKLWQKVDEFGQRMWNERKILRFHGI